MKLCYDNDTIYYSKGKFRLIGYHAALFYFESCEECGDEFVSKSKNAIFCSKKCSTTGKRNPMYGKHWDAEKKKIMAAKLSVQRIGKNNPMYGKCGNLSPTYERKHTLEERKKMSLHRKLWWSVLENKEKMSKAFTGKIISDNQKDKLKVAFAGHRNHQWKGGVTAKNIPLYDTYAPQIEPYEECRRNVDDPNILEVRCTYCGKWYEPNKKEVTHRICAINSNGGSNFYCCDECKQACSIFNQQKYPKGHKLDNNRSHQYELKVRTFEKDEGLCQICGIEVTPETSICHHEVPVAINGLISLDDDNVWTLCFTCDKHAHSLPGCSYGEIRKRVQEMKECNKK